MEYLVTGKESRAYDRDTMETFFVPAEVLMEQAAQALAEQMKESFGSKESVLFVCGSGNNGGDGIAAARLLCLSGVRAAVYAPLAEGAHRSPLCEMQMKIYEAYGFPLLSGEDWEGLLTHKEETAAFSHIVDAVFGTGLSRPISGSWAQIIAEMNALPGKKWAVDISSGVSADTGEVLGIAFSADVTVTFSFKKLGQVLFPGAAESGELIVSPIGITARSFSAAGTPAVCSLTIEDLMSLPPRRKNSHKGTYGHLLLFAGSYQMTGAAVLAAQAAVRMGTGLVKVMTSECSRLILQTAVPEAILRVYPDEPKEKTGKKKSESRRQAAHEASREEYEEKIAQAVEEELSWADAVVIGPGIGRAPAMKRAIQTVLDEAQIPVLLDADALNILAENPRMLTESVHDRSSLVVTPHMGEMSRLIGVGTAEIKKDPINVARSYAQNNRLTCVLKDARTVTAAADGTIYVNQSGNNGMATAGSGDVLSGMIGALLAQGMPADAAAPLGVFVHGLAGDAAKERLGARFMCASDIVNALADVLPE